MGGVVKQKKGQKKTPFKKRRHSSYISSTLGKKNNQKAKMMNQPTTFMHLCKNLHIYMSRN